MLIKTSVNDFINKESSDHTDAISIDISSEKSFKKEQEQEVYSNLNRLGIRINE
jgi:hypothetical protein